jgi:hypothetical protein
MAYAYENVMYYLITESDVHGLLAAWNEFKHHEIFSISPQTSNVNDLQSKKCSKILRVLLRFALGVQECVVWKVNAEIAKSKFNVKHKLPLEESELLRYHNAPKVL